MLSRLPDIFGMAKSSYEFHWESAIRSHSTAQLDCKQRHVYDVYEASSGQDPVRKGGICTSKPPTQIKQKAFRSLGHSWILNRRGVLGVPRTEALPPAGQAAGCGGDARGDRDSVSWRAPSRSSRKHV